LPHKARRAIIRSLAGKIEILQALVAKKKAATFPWPLLE
jgi:hypothetical protein